MKKLNKHLITEIILSSVIAVLLITILVIAIPKGSKSNNPTTKKAAFRETVYIVNITHVYHSEKCKVIDKKGFLMESDVEWYSTYKFTLQTSDGKLELLSDIFPKVEEKKDKKYYVTLQYQNGEYFFPNSTDMSASEYWDDWVWDNK